jgi:hypothetical protein
MAEPEPEPEMASTDRRPSLSSLAGLPPIDLMPPIGVPDGAGSDTFAYVTEYNAYTNGSKCSHDVSPQCSGVFLSKDGGMTFEHIDWQGTLRFHSVEAVGDVAALCC